MTPEQYRQKMGDIASLHNTQMAEITREWNAGKITEKQARDAFRYIDVQRNKAVNAAYKKLTGKKVYSSTGKAGRKPKGVR